MLNNVIRTWDAAGSGTFNGGRYSNPKLDALIDAIRVEPDITKRRAMTGDALRIHEQRTASGSAVSAQVDVGDAAEHRRRAMAERCA